MALTIGCTIKEAQQRISLKEFEIWIRYRKKFGPMNPIRRYDAGPALISSIVARMNGAKNIKASDFMPYGNEEDDIVVDEEGFLDALDQTGKVKYGR